MKACWAVLRLDRELLFYPILSALALFLFFVSVFGSFVTGENLPQRLNNLTMMLENASEWQLILVGFLFYFVISFIMVFFNSALIASVKIRLAGGDPKIVDGLQIAIKLIPQIAAWALVSATVGIILDQLEQRSKGLASWVVAALGAGWAVAVYFVVPVLVTERTGPVKAVKRSVALIRKTWGEALVSVVGFTAIGGLIAFAAVAVAIMAAVVHEFSPLIGAAIAVTLVVTIVFAALILTTLGSVFRAVLYVYATNGNIPPSFDQTMIENNFPNKKNDQN